MKNPILFFVILFLAASTASADIQTISDPFPGTSCASDTCDVIGPNAFFDIQKIELSFVGGGLDVSIFTNYGNPTPLSLAPWDDGLGGGKLLSIGDLFFGFPNLAYGVPLDTHDGFQAGGLYKIGDPIGTRTAGNVLFLGSGWVYRPYEVVWLGGTPGTPAATGTVINSFNPSGSLPKPTYKIDLSFSTLPQDFWDQLSANGGSMNVQFASATCANDIIKGTAVVPEPSTVLTLGTLLVLLAALTVRRTRRAPAEQRPRG